MEACCEKKHGLENGMIAGGDREGFEGGLLGFWGGGGLERWEVVGGDQERDGIEDGIGRVKERGK